MSPLRRMSRAIGLASIDVARERPNPDLVFEASRDTPHESLSTAWTIETAGKRADLIQVSHVGGHPVVRRVWRSGNRVIGRFMKLLMPNATRTTNSNIGGTGLRIAQAETFIKANAARPFWCWSALPRPSRAATR